MGTKNTYQAIGLCAYSVSYFCISSFVILYSVDLSYLPECVQTAVFEPFGDSA